MKKIIDPSFNFLSNQNAKKDIRTDYSYNATRELGPIQKDRSFLPKAKDAPVHKCGC